MRALARLLGKEFITVSGATGLIRTWPRHLASGEHKMVTNQSVRHFLVADLASLRATSRCAALSAAGCSPSEARGTLLQPLQPGHQNDCSGAPLNAVEAAIARTASEPRATVVQAPAPVVVVNTTAP